MNNVLRTIKNLFYALPFGLRAADSEIMGNNDISAGNDTSIKQQVQDKRVAKHLLKGEITQEVEELRYRTYKIDRETDKYNYVGNGIAVKKGEKEKKSNFIKFSQPNKVICSDVLTELKRVDGYGDERYIVDIDYMYPVRIKMEQFITLVDVYIREGEKPITTLHFSSVMNPSEFKSKPFVNNLEKLYTNFNNNDTYAISRNDYATSLLCMNFTTNNATDDEPNIVNYSFTSPELIAVQKDNGEYLLKYQWKTYNRIDLTDKFFNAELEEKYKNKEKKNIKVETEIKDSVPFNAENAPNFFIKCSKCGRDINKYIEGYIADKNTGEPICIDCYKKSLLDSSK